LCALYIDCDCRVIQNYIVFVRIRNQFSYLPNALVPVRDIFNGRTQDDPDWEACMARAMGDMGYPTGAVYVEKHFSAEDRAQV
jgi:predicted metalloendopeptidase